MLLIGRNDGPNQGVTNDILFAEMMEIDSRSACQCPYRLNQAARLVLGEIDLRPVARDHAP